MGFLKNLFGKSVKCSSCGAKPDPSIYRTGAMIMGGDFGKCPSCGKVFCGNCKVVRWLDKSKTMWLAYCPYCDEQLKADIF
jgi:hypothetical protein